MADTIREQIIQDYLLRLEAWTVSNGFEYDCGNNATRATKEIEDIPACVLWPGNETSEDASYGEILIETIFKVEAFVLTENGNHSIIQEKLLGDVIKIMTDRDEVISNKIESIFYIAGGSAELPKTEDINTAISAEFKIKYKTLAGNPYSQ